MRETIVHVLCDVHHRDGEQVVATLTRRVAVDRYRERELDLCEVCDKSLFEPLFAALGIGARATAMLDEPDGGRYAMIACELCGEVVQRHSMTQHLNGARHLAGTLTRPDGDCPECGRTGMSVNGLATHRIRAHGWDRLGEAYAQARAAQDGQWEAGQ